MVVDGPLFSYYSPVLDLWWFQEVPLSEILDLGARSLQWWHGKMMGIKNSCLLVKETKLITFGGNTNRGRRAWPPGFLHFFKQQRFFRVPRTSEVLVWGRPWDLEITIPKFSPEFFFWSRKINFNLYEAGWTGWHTRRHKGLLFFLERLKIYPNQSKATCKKYYSFLSFSIISQPNA